MLPPAAPARPPLRCPRACAALRGTAPPGRRVSLPRAGGCLASSPATCPMVEGMLSMLGGHSGTETVTSASPRGSDSPAQQPGLWAEMGSALCWGLGPSCVSSTAPIPVGDRARAGTPDSLLPFPLQPQPRRAASSLLAPSTGPGSHRTATSPAPQQPPSSISPPAWPSAPRSQRKPTTSRRPSALPPAPRRSRSPPSRAGRPPAG